MRVHFKKSGPIGPISEEEKQQNETSPLKSLLTKMILESLKGLGDVSLFSRQVDFKNKSLKFNSVVLPENISEESRQIFREQLKNFEEQILPNVLLREPLLNYINKSLGTMCRRVDILLDAWAKILSSSGIKKIMLAGDVNKIRMLTDMHTDPTFSPIKEFSGHVGWNFLSKKKVIEEGNPRERMLFLLNVVRNLLKPKIEELENKAKFWQQLNKNLPKWQIPEYFEGISSGEYFDFTKDLRKKDPAMKSQKLIFKDMKNMRIPLSVREKRYIEYMIQQDHPGSHMEDKPIYWGSGKTRAITYPEKPDNTYLQAIQNSQLLQRCSVSGVTGDLFGLLPMLGLSEEKFKYSFRLACLATLLDGKNHSVAEILTATLSFGLPFVFTPDYYFYLLPDSREKNDLITYLKEELKVKGLKFPHEYLSK